MQRFLAAILLALTLCQPAALAAPLRVFIRAGEKTHGPGAHDHPAFLNDWTKLLNERGAQTQGALAFPTAAQLADTDVLILNCADAGNIEGDDRTNLEAFLRRGGGLVVVHAGAVSRDAVWYQNIIGGSWKWGQTKWLEGPMSLYFSKSQNPIIKNCSNFDLDDEIYYDMMINPMAKILATSHTPAANKESEGHEPGKEPHIHQIAPQIWTYEGVYHRAFVCLPGHLHRNFSHNSLQTILLRSIAWTGKRPNVDEFCKPEELDNALRHPEGGATPPKATEKKPKLPRKSISHTLCLKSFIHTIIADLPVRFRSPPP